MAHEVESMFYVGETPWHGLGVPLENRPTSEEAIKMAGLDWEVGLKDLCTYSETDGVMTAGEKVSHKAAYRVDNGRILGVVGPGWKPLQNREAFKFFDPFVEAGQASYETAGSLRYGGRIWILAHLTGDPLVVSGDDVVRKYLLLSNGHDGTLAIRVGFTPVRVVCANTLAAAHGDAASSLIRVTHTKRSGEALEKLRDVMNVVNQKFEATAEQYRVLASKGCTDDDLKKYVNLVFAPKRVEKEIAAAALEERAALSAEDLRSTVYPKVLELFQNGRGAELPGVRGTLWGAYNAINEYIVHVRGKDAAKRLDSTWFGSGANQNLRALKVGVEMAITA